VSSERDLAARASPRAYRIRRLLRFVLCVSLLLLVAWAVLALYHFEHWPHWVGAVLAGLWLAAIAAALYCWGLSRWIVLAILGDVLLVRLLWCWQDPSAVRDWEPVQRHQAAARADGDTLVVEHLRHARYRSETSAAIAWESRRYRLSELERVELFIEPFARWRGMAHAFISFGFADGDWLALSIEARRERGERYGPLAGCFRRYELLYVLADERDVIGLRALLRGNPIYRYRLKIDAASARSLLRDVLDRAAQLRSEPEFYHSVSNSCSSNLVAHIERLAEAELGLDWRTVMPGNADELAAELELIELDRGELPRFRERYRIDVPALPMDGRAWSQAIRAGADGATDDARGE